jgi:hypothetical protein
LTEILKTVCEINLKREHLLSERNLKQLRLILRADEKTWPDARLHRHVDEMAINIGLDRKIERQVPTVERIENLERLFIAPAKTLAATLADHEISKELHQSWGGFVGFEIKTFEKSIATFFAASHVHLKILKKSSKRGKVWDSELRDRFVELVSMLCEYVDPNFEPKRKSQEDREQNSSFRDVVRMLGQPIFGDFEFDGAIRKLVDRWNKNKKEKIKKITKREAVAEKDLKP